MAPPKKGAGPVGPATSTKTTTAGHHSHGHPQSSDARCQKCRGLLTRPDSVTTGLCLYCSLLIEAVAC